MAQHIVMVQHISDGIARQRLNFYITSNDF